MNTYEQTRRAHRIVDALKDSRILNSSDVDFLRSFLPELPTQKTLEEITWDIHFAWCETSGNDWKEELFGNLETWLSEQHNQLRAHLEGVKSQAHPALPAGMRIAEHENFGRVVVSPGVGIDRCHEIFYLDPGMSSGTDISEVEPDSLTFLSPKPAHPEFLETEADYQNAPEGTVVALDETDTLWLKEFGAWRSTAGDHGVESVCIALDSRRILRWGWSK